MENNNNAKQQRLARRAAHERARRIALTKQAKAAKKKKEPTLNELRNKCRSKGLLVSGTKATLIERLRANSPSPNVDVSGDDEEVSAGEPEPWRPPGAILILF